MENSIFYISNENVNSTKNINENSSETYINKVEMVQETIMDSPMSDDFDMDDMDENNEATSFHEEGEEYTDNEEEIAADMVECVQCGTHTHISNEKCSNCGQVFKISRTGYLMTDGFIADEESDPEGEHSERVSSDEEEEFSSGESDTEMSEEDVPDMCAFLDEEDEYKPSSNTEVTLDAPRRITRSMTKKQ
jgi:hypothetical protein